MDSYTPGHWGVYESDNAYGIFSGDWENDNEIDVVCAGPLVDGGYGGITNKMDAQLIAAAPNMLEVLRDIYSLRKRGEKAGEDYPLIVEALASRAIDMATGVTL